MTIGISTWCREPDEGPRAFADRVAALGASHLALDSRLPGAWLEAFLTEPPGLPVSVVEAPCPRPRAARDPELTAADKEERLAAGRLVREALDLAARVGAGTLVVRLGRLAADSDWPRAVRRLALGQTPHPRDLHRQRLMLAPRALDHARFGLEPLLDAAGAKGVTLALTSRARWFEMPDQADLGVLLADFAGAPLAGWYDAGAAHARALMTGEPATGFLAALGERVTGMWRSDASGLVHGLPWGTGEIDRAQVASALPKAAQILVHCAPGASTEELARALAA